MAEFIEIEHPDIEGSRTHVAESAFKHLEDKGWVRVGSEAAVEVAEEEPDADEGEGMTDIEEE